MTRWLRSRLPFGFAGVYLVGYLLLVGPAVSMSRYVGYGLLLSLGVAIYFGIWQGEQLSKSIRPARISLRTSTETIRLMLIPFTAFLNVVALFYVATRGFSEASRLDFISEYGAVFRLVTIGFTPVVLQAVSNAERIGIKEKLLIVLYGLVPLLIGSRSVFLMFVIGLSIIFNVRQSSIPIVKMLLAGLGVLAVLVGVTWLRGYGHGNVEVAFSALYYRIFSINASNAARIVDYYHTTRDFLNGGSILMDIKSLAPGPHRAFSGEITALLRSDIVAHVGITPTVLGESFANFGSYCAIYGVIFLFLVLVTNWVFSKSNALGFNVWIKINLFWTITGGVGPFIALKFPLILFFFLAFKLMIDLTRTLRITGVRG
jgi:hypothetical protein